MLGFAYLNFINTCLLYLILLVKYRGPHTVGKTNSCSSIRTHRLEDQRVGDLIYQNLFVLASRDGQFRIPNPKDPNPKLSESNNRIRFPSCLQALSRCLVTDFLFVKVSITCIVPSKILVSV